VYSEYMLHYGMISADFFSYSLSKL